MINEFQRMMLSNADSEFQKARFDLFKAISYLEHADKSAFEKTISEIKQVIKDLHNSTGEIIDFMNKQDFPDSI